MTSEDEKEYFTGARDGRVSIINTHLGLTIIHGESIPLFRFGVACLCKISKLAQYIVEHNTRSIFDVGTIILFCAR